MGDMKSPAIIESFTASQIIVKGPVKVHSIWIFAAAVLAYVVAYDGLSTSGTLKIAVGAQIRETFQFQPKYPMELRQGLYMSLNGVGARYSVEYEMMKGAP